MSSEPATFPAVAAPPPGGAPAPVVLQGHLHPAVLVLRLLEALRHAGFLLVLGLAADRLFLIAAGIVFLVHLGNGLVRYLTYQYRLTTDELVTREGILSRQERRIPIDRVQDLGFESTILRRVLRLAVVRVETASGEGAEAVLDSLGRADAEHLRELLLQLRARRTAAAAPLAAAGSSASPGPPPDAAPEPEWTVYAAPPGHLLLRGLTDLRVSAILVAAFGAQQLADQLGMLAMLRGAGDTFFAWLRAFPLAFAAALLLAMVAVVLAASVAASAFGNLLAFHGFRLSLRADTLLCRFGLLTTRQKALPRVRVQRVHIDQTWLRRLLGIAVARADSAGGSRGVGDEAPGGFDLVVPLAPLPRIDALLPALLPGLAVASAPQRPSVKLVLRVFLAGACWLAVALAIAAPFAGAHAWWGLLLLPLPWAYGRLRWHNSACALWPGHLYLRVGVLGRYQVLMPTGKVQAVALHRGPLQRLLLLADLSVFVAGGPPTRLRDLDFATAESWLRALAERAAASAATDWGVAWPAAPAAATSGIAGTARLTPPSGTVG